ncbi:MAG: lytic transglycosylase domain-containing protein, partial [Acidimicrobiales bacterium]
MRSALAVLAIALAAASACGRGDEAGADLERRAASTTSSTAAPTTTSSTIVTTTTAPTTTTTAPAVVASDPAGLAAQIVAAERTIRDPVTPPEAVAPAARIQQLAYRLLGQHPEWDAAVAAAVPADLQDVVARNVAARRDFR